MIFKKYNIINLSTFLAVLTGIIFPVTFFSDWFGLLAWVCFVPVLFAIKNKKPKESFFLGILTGLIINWVALYWLVGTLTRFGGLPVAVSILFIFIFCLYSSIQFGIFTYFISKFKLLQAKSALNCLIIALIWAAVEYFYPVLFPYGIGNSQGFYLSIIQVVDLFGLNFLSFLILFINVSVFFLLKGEKFPTSTAILSVIIIIFILIYGYFRINNINSIVQNSEKINVGIVQANFDFFEKNIENEFFITERHQKMSEEIKNADLIIWPETAIQHWFPTNGKIYQVQDTRNVAPDIKGTYFLIGGLSFIAKESWNGNKYQINYIKHNTAFLTDSKSNILGRYNKIKLLLFGEYFPQINSKLGFIKKIIPAVGDLTPGEELNLLEVKEKELRIGTLICYEDIIPYFGREFANKGSNLLINLTNDAWFGKSTAPYQHLLVSIPRAVETRRYFIRSTNSGVSAIISPTGLVENKSGIFTKENLQGDVALVNSYKTLYSKVGDIFPWISLLFLVLYFFTRHLIRKYSF